MRLCRGHCTGKWCSTEACAVEVKNESLNYFPSVKLMKFLHVIKLEAVEIIIIIIIIIP